MAMQFEELDDVTRRYMLSELEAEFAGNPYLSDGLTPEGRAALPNLMREAIRADNEVTLAASLAQLRYWQPMETYRTKTGRIMRRYVNVREAAERLALTEFNTWYVRGLAKRLMEEGGTHCQVYRAAPPKGAPGECTRYEEQVFTVDVIYRGHRARYWPTPNPGVLSIPAGPNCHHTIRRVT
jgi:hypothetical protein